MNVAVLVPILGRPHHIAPLVESIRSTCRGARIVFGCSPDDADVIAELDARGEEMFTIPGPRPGDYARKINHGARITSEELLFLGASDLLFHPGWFEAVTACLADGIGVVGTNDLGSPRVMAGEHATHSLVTRDYIEQFGTIDQPGRVLHEGYEHEYVDDEFVLTAKHRCAWAFAAQAHVEHLHPSWGKAPTDALYSQQRRRMQRGRYVFQRRRHLWT